MNHWTERREGGSRFALVVIRWCILHVGRGVARCIMWPTALYFYLRRGPERRASRQWLERVGAPRRGARGCLRHIFTFAMTIVDRVLLLSDRDDALEIRTEGVEALHDTLAHGRGCVLLGSHLGSFEAIRASHRHAPWDWPLRVVMDRQQNALMTEVLEALDPTIRDTVIDARQPGPEIVLRVSEVLGRGGIVAMLADRAHRQEAVVRVPFLGRSAPFPVAPLAIAGLLEAPVFLVFGLYEGGNRYRLVFEPMESLRLSGRSRAAKRAQLTHRIADYARALEHHARRYPFNWFNFYDFWDPGRGTAGADGEHPDPGR